MTDINLAYEVLSYCKDYILDAHSLFLMVNENGRSMTKSALCNLLNLLHDRGLIKWNKAGIISIIPTATAMYFLRYDKLFFLMDEGRKDRI